MTQDLLVVQRTAPEEMERALLAALEPAVQAAVWAAVQPVLAATISAHVRALVQGAAPFPQPSFVPPPAPVIPPVGVGTGHARVRRPDAEFAADTSAVAPPAPPEGPAPDDAPPPQKKYKMGKGSPHRYDDIAWNEIPEDEFDLSEAWTRYLEPIIDYDSERAPENYRRAVRQDTKRFEISEDLRRARKKKLDGVQQDESAGSGRTLPADSET